MRAAVALALAAVAAAARAAPQPALTLVAGHGLVVRRLSSVLEEGAVSRHLESGLTTTFLLRAEASGHVLGGARVDVRYDLWDEVFEVVTVEPRGRGTRATLAGRAELERWWSGLELVVAGPDALASPPPRALVLVVEVIPFSASEQDDTQRWFVRSFGATPATGSPRVTDAAERRGDSLEKVLSVLMATSIRSSVLCSRRWAVTVAEEP